MRSWGQASTLLTKYWQNTNILQRPYGKWRSCQRRASMPADSHSLQHWARGSLIFASVEGETAVDCGLYFLTTGGVESLAARTSSPLAGTVPHQAVFSSDSRCSFDVGMYALVRWLTGEALLVPHPAVLWVTPGPRATSAVSMRLPLPVPVGQRGEHP